MHSNVIKFDKSATTNSIEYNSINTSQKQNIKKLILNKISGILNQDIDKGLAMIEHLLSQKELDCFKSELQEEFKPQYSKENQSINYNRRLKTLKSCFEGLPADNIL